MGKRRQEVRQEAFFHHQDNKCSFVSDNVLEDNGNNIITRSLIAIRHPSIWF